MHHRHQHNLLINTHRQSSTPWMGQSSSSSLSSGNFLVPDHRESNHSRRFLSRSTAMICPMLPDVSFDSFDDDDDEGERTDYISDLPDECLAYIFQFLTSADRKNSSLVCRRWLCIEGQSHQRLSLNAQSEIISHIPSLFTRFDSVTKLALRCDRRSVSINDDAMDLISIRCRNLTRLKLRGCREVTHIGMAKFAKNCKGLKKLSCGSCVFGAKGMNAILDNCSSLEELSVKRLRGGTNDASGAGTGAYELVGPGVAASSLKVISLKELYIGQSFGPLIIGSKKLKTLKLFRCLGDWDRLLEVIGNGNTSLVEVHLERLQVSDFGLSAISNCSNLEVLHIVKTPECSNFGLISVAEHCNQLRKLHIDGWRTNRIGDDGLIAIAKRCPNLQELVLIGVNPTSTSLTAIASNCQNLERLALCGSETIGDAEISSIATKCTALRKICIKGCPISNQGMQALAWGFPNLVKAKVKKCRGVTGESADWLKMNRASLVVTLDVHREIEEVTDVSGSDVGGQDTGVVFQPAAAAQVNADEISNGDDASSSSSNGRSPVLFKAKFSIFAGRNFVACTFGGWSSKRNSND